MKTLHLILLLGLALCACNHQKETQNAKLAYTSTFSSVPITSLSASGTPGILYMGLENGDVVVKNWLANVQDTIDAGNDRVYDVYEHTTDTLLVGIRDEGLKLIVKKQLDKNYKIADKGTRYSVYSIAFDSTTNMFNLGTSNGCYRLPAGALCPQDNLLPFVLNDEKHSAVSKVICRNSEVYMAADSGLYIVRKAQSKPEEFFKGQRVTTITLEGDRLWVSRDTGIQRMKVDSIDEKAPFIADGKYFACATHGSDSWLLAQSFLLYEKDGVRYRHELPDGINMKGRQLGLIDNNYFYVAYKEELLAFPLHQNITGAANNIVAVSDGYGTGDAAHFITGDGRLHRYSFLNNPDNRSEEVGCIGNLPKIESGINKFIQVGKDSFYLATDKCLYRINHRKATLVKDLGADSNNDFKILCYSGEKLYVGTRHFLGVFDEKTDSIIPVSVKVDEAVDTTDLYVTNIAEDAQRHLYVLTLHKGLFVKTKNDTSFTKVDIIEKLGNSLGMTINDETVFMKLSKGSYKYHQGKVDSIKSEPKSIRAIATDKGSNQIFIIGYYGVSRINITDTSWLHQITYGNDIPFDKAKIAVNNNNILLGSRYGLFLFEKNQLKPVYIDSKEKFQWWMIVFGVVILVSIVLLVGFLNKILQKIKRRQIKKDIKTLVRSRINGDNESLKLRCKKMIADYKHDLQLLWSSIIIKEDDERCYIAILYCIEDIMPQDIYDTLEVLLENPQKDTLAIGRERYQIHLKLEELRNNKNKKAMNSPLLNFLYERTKRVKPPKI